MSGLLKAGAQRARPEVQPFAAPLPPTPPEPSAAEQRIAHLEREIADLVTRREADALAARKREQAAFAEGEQAGRARAETHDRDRLQALAQAMEAAHKAHATGLEQLEVLALSVAQTALARVFGDHSRYARMVSDTVLHQLATLDRALVTQIRVSPVDYTDDQALAALTHACPDIALRTDAVLAAGDCVIDLRLGRVDAGLASQWQGLSHVLGTLAEADTRP